MNSLPKTVTRQRRGCDLNPDPSAPESSTLTTRLPSHPLRHVTYTSGLLDDVTLAHNSSRGGGPVLGGKRMSVPAARPVTATGRAAGSYNDELIAMRV